MARFAFLGLSCVLLSGCAISSGNTDENGSAANESATENAGVASQRNRDRTALAEDPAVGTIAPFGVYDLAHPAARAGADGADFFPHQSSASEERARAVVEHDLALVLTRTTVTPFEGTNDPALHVTIVNRSRDTAHPVVSSQDGSSEGWREPWIFYTVETRVANGAFQPAKQASYGRCGMYKHDWWNDVVALAPGDATTLEWFSFFGYDGAIQDADAIRVTAHYEYRRGNVFRSVFAASNVPPSMQDVPAFSLTSEPIEIPIERPLRIDAAIKSLPLEPGAMLGDAISVTATNITAHDVTLPKMSGNIQLEVEGTRVLMGERTEQSAWFGVSRGTAAAGEEMITLAPGEKITLDGLTQDDPLWRLSAEEVAAMSVTRARVNYSWSFITPKPNAPTEEDDTYPFVEQSHSATGAWIPLSTR